MDTEAKPVAPAPVQPAPVRPHPGPPHLGPPHLGPPPLGPPPLAPRQFCREALAPNLWDQLKQRSPADRRLVHTALTARLNSAASRVGIGLGALSLAERCVRTCAAELGASPSRREYDAWRAAKSDRRELLSSTAIRSTFGGWTTALEALQLDVAPDVLGDALTRRGPRFSDEELLAALRAWHADTTYSTHTQGSYRAFARRVRGDWATARRRIPLSTAPFVQRFGSWSEARVKAGLPIQRLHHGRREDVTGASADLTTDRLLLCAGQGCVHARLDSSPGSLAVADPLGADRAERRLRRRVPATAVAWDPTLRGACASKWDVVTQAELSALSAGPGATR